MKTIKQLIWPLIMALYGMAILILMIMGDLKSYIHPKLHILSFLAMIILFILAVATAKENLSKGHIPKIKMTYMVFIIPLLLFFIGTDADASRQVAAENGIKISALPNTRKIEKNKDLKQDVNATQQLDNSTQTQNDLTKNTTTDLDTQMPIKPKETAKATDNAETKNTETLYLTDVNFTALMEDMHLNLSDYKGRKITYLGLIYKQEDFKNDEIVVGRLLMYCCAADAQIIGLLGHFDKAIDYKDGDWVTITGYVDEKNYKDPYSDYEEAIPYLIIEDIQAAKEPEDPYVYFNE